MRLKSNGLRSFHFQLGQYRVAQGTFLVTLKPSYFVGRALPKKSIDLFPKCLLDREMRTKTIALSLGLILAAGALYAANPMEGTWKLNESKSKLTRGTGKSTKVVYDSRLIRDKMTVTVDGVDADGKPVP